MSNLRLSTYRLYQSALTVVCFGIFSFASLQTVAKPQLVTLQLPPAIQGQAYAASLVVGSAVPLANAAVAGLPPGLSFSQNGSGSIAITGTPTIAGTFALNFVATDNAAGALNTTVVLTVYQVASNVTSVSAGDSHSCAVVNGGVQCWGDNKNGELADVYSGPVLRPVTTLIKSTSTPISLPFALSSNNSVAGYGDALTLSAAVGGNGQTGTVTFSAGTVNGLTVLPGCEAVKLVAGLASCTVPGSYQTESPRLYQATYSGDTYNLPTSANLSQVTSTTSAVLSVAATPLPPIRIGSTTTLTALVKMNTPSGSVTFSDNGVPITGCAQVTLSLLPNATDAAVATCTVAAPASASGFKQYQVTYFYPAGHVSGNVSEKASFDLRVSAQAFTDYTDMWWTGPSENGWGMSVTQHGPIQFNVIFAYDNLGKSIWYVMPGGSFNAAGTTFTGQLYLPTSSPFSAYDKTKFAIGAAVGSATITYTSDGNITHSSNGNATLVYTINGVSGTKSIRRQIFATETSGPNLRTNDLWWATSAEDGWGINIAQQGRVLFPVWYTYDAAGKATFFTAQGGSWNGTVWSGSIFSHTSSLWLGVTYNPGAFTATNVGTISLDFTDASNATMTTTVNGFTQVRHIERQPY